MISQPGRRSWRGGADPPMWRLSDTMAHPAQRYFTDGSNLYRFAGWLIRSRSAGLIALEDCRTLEILLASADDFSGAALRPVD